MPITLITGLPGHGKTLYTLVRTKEEAARDGRPVFHNSIPDLALPWQEWDPLKWFELPAGGIMVIDECQRVFPIRGRGAEVPPHVRELETHRHKGLDLTLITQDPMLIDPHVRRLVDRHFHVVRKFGTHFATIHEYTNGVRDMVAKSRGDSIRHEWRYPKEAFGWYRSAEVHTVKRRIPMRVYLMLLVPLVVLGAVGLFVTRAQERVDGTRTTMPAEITERTGSAVSGGGFRAAGEWMSPQEWGRWQHPRIAGLPHTAPAYDEVTRPVVAPYPAACIASATVCRCYSQQATALDTPEALCRGIAAGGFFVSWEQPAAVAVAAPEKPAADLAPVSVPVGLGEGYGMARRNPAGGLPSSKAQDGAGAGRV